ncbi:DUF6279 family lipoprotein [Kineobactrum salinum]|uniref:Lipoprotein n=1 Tax=Kineobactrum salinum TaxID=2708301 RepID=A0A6C0U0Q5_9GAMM|nr:DUF6279 family lipoprotein [Kineobactrum salinum]QIB65690.1 hypothetical protein G3T16_09965 [Kineobactrum salinum]
MSDRPWLRVRVLAACLLLVLLAGCSSTKFFYNRLDFFLPWYLGDYVELEREQEDYLKQELLPPFLHWHRSEELPRYVALLDEVLASLDREVTTAQLDDFTGSAEQALDRLQTRALDWMLALGRTLDEDQLAGFHEALLEQQAEFEEEYLERSDEEFRDDACERVEDRARKYLGRLQREQKAQLASACGQLRRSDQLWLDERAQWLQRLRDLLQRESGWEQELREAVAQRGNTVSDSYRAVYDYNFRTLQRAVAELLNSRTQRQDSHLRRELNKLRRDLRQLSEAT